MSASARISTRPAEGFTHELVITPRMAFGTGHHATTRMMVQAMLPLDLKGKEVCDLGCGTACWPSWPRRMGATQCWPSTSIPGRWTTPGRTWCGTVVRPSLWKRAMPRSLEGRTYDAILANIERNILLRRHARAWRDALKPGGALFLSGFVVDDRHMMAQSAKDMAWNLPNGWKKADGRCSDAANLEIGMRMNASPDHAACCAFRAQRRAPCRAAGLHPAVALPAQAQTKPFSTDQALFLQEMTDFLVAADKKEGKPFMEEVFTPVWNGTYYSERQRMRIVEVANFMLKKRFEAFPHFRDYLAAVAAFPNSGRSAAEFDAWMQGMDELVQSGAQAERGRLHRHLRRPLQGQHPVRQRQHQLAQPAAASSPSRSTACRRWSSQARTWSARPKGTAP